MECGGSPVRFFLAILVVLIPLAPAARLCGDDESSRGIRLGEATTTQWRIGVTFHGTVAYTSMLATTPVPMDWPEQQVKIVAEEKSANVSKIGYLTLDDGVKQMLVTMPRLNAGDDASAIVTFEVTRSRIL